MNILIANDDGVFAPGIQALANALRPLGRVVIVAPEAERSGFSSAVLAEGVDAAAAERQFQRYAAFYQGDALQPLPRFARDTAGAAA